MERIRIHDIRIQEEITAAMQWFQRESHSWLRYISQEDQRKFQEDDMWNDLMHVIIYAFRMYGHSRKRTVQMAGLLCLLRCSGHLHDFIQDGMVELDKQVQYRLLVGDQMMARALEQLTEDEAYVLIPYFARLVIKMSEGMVWRMERSRTDAEILEYTHAPWYEAAFYSAACLANQTDLQQKRAGKLGFHLGMIFESKRENISLHAKEFFQTIDWKVLPNGWEKESLIQFTQKILALPEEDSLKTKVSMMK